MAAAFRIAGALDVAALQRSIDALAARHTALRVHFEIEHGALVQVAGAVDAQIRIVELGSATEDEIGARLLAEVDQPFDLGRGPPFRVVLVRRGPVEHVLLIVVDHLVSDAASLAILFRELEALYAHHVDPSAGLDLPAVPDTYGRSEAREQAQLSNPSFLEALNAQRRLLAGRRLPPHLEDAPDHPPRWTRGVERHARMGREGAERVRRACVELDCTPFMAFVAAYWVFLWKTLEQADFAFEFPISTRRRDDAALVARLLNMTAVRIKLSPRARVADLLSRVKGVLWQAYRDRDVPAFKRPPPFWHLFQINAFPELTFRLPELEVTEYSFQPRCAAPLLLELRLSEGDIGVWMRCPPERDLAHPQRYIDVLSRLFVDPTRRLNAL